MSQSNQPPGGNSPPGQQPPAPQQGQMPGVSQQPAMIQQPQGYPPQGYPPQGYPPQGYQYPPAPPVKKKDETLALVSLLLGVASWVFGLNIIGAVPAIIIGVMARKKIKMDPENYGGDGMALGGIVSGAVMTGFTIVIMLVFVFFYIILPLGMLALMALLSLVGVAAGA